MNAKEAIKELHEIRPRGEIIPQKRAEAIDVAIQALEKQIPKKPRKSGVTDSNGVFHPVNGIDGVPYELCPCCKINLCTDGYFGRDKKRMKYCENCGQALVWRDSDE